MISFFSSFTFIMFLLPDAISLSVAGRTRMPTLMRLSVDDGVVVLDEAKLDLGAAGAMEGRIIGVSDLESGWLRFAVVLVLDDVGVVVAFHFEMSRFNGIRFGVANDILFF